MSGQPAIGTGQTRVGQELIEEENEMRFLEWCIARAALQALKFKNDLFRHFSGLISVLGAYET